MRASQCRIWTAANTLPHKAGDDFTVKSHRLSNNGQSAILIEDEKRSETVIPDGAGGRRQSLSPGVEDEDHITGRVLCHSKTGRHNQFTIERHCRSGTSHGPAAGFASADRGHRLCHVVMPK